MFDYAVKETCFLPVPMDLSDLEAMRAIDRRYPAHPWYGVRRLAEGLSRQGLAINRKRVHRLMQVMGIRAVFPQPFLSQGNQAHRVYPCLLRGLPITRPDLWCADITSIRMNQGFWYLTAMMGSRAGMSWELSSTLESGFCLKALGHSLEPAQLDLFNPDQGTRFTSQEWITCLQDREIRISMDGRGRCFDTIFIERLWRLSRMRRWIENKSKGKELVNMVRIIVVSLMMAVFVLMGSLALANSLVIYDVAVATGNLTTLVAAVEASGLVEELIGEGPLTVFAPTDEAFAKLPEGTVEALLKDKAALQTILLYHMLPGAVLSESMTDGVSIETLQGGPVVFSVTEEAVMINDAIILEMDMKAFNGVLHLIDTVMLPPKE